MKQTTTFDFGRIVDGLTIEIRVNEMHRQNLRLQMTERFQARQGQWYLKPTMKIAAAILVGCSVISIGIMIQTGGGGKHEATLARVEAAAAAHDLPALTDYLSIDSLPVQLATVGHLAVLGNSQSLVALEALLAGCTEPELREAIQQAMTRIRQRSLPPAPEPNQDTLPVAPPRDVNTVGELNPRQVETVTVEAPDFEFSVVDDQTGTPILGAHVQFSWPKEKREVVTDVHGYSAVAYGEKQPYYFRARVWKSGYAGRLVEWRPGDMGQTIPKAYTIRLRPGVTLSGRVLDETNQPVAGAKIKASIGLNEALKEQLYLHNNSSVTDANGYWSIADYSSRPAASQYAKLTLEHASFITKDWHGILDAFSDLVAGSHVIKVFRGLVLAGQVIDHLGEPIVGAHITEGYDTRFDKEPAAITDAQGRFAIKRLQAGQKIITVTAPGYAPEMKVLPFDTSQQDEVFVLEPGHVLRFEVTDPQGKPLRGATVKTYAWRTFSPMQRTMNLLRKGTTNTKGATTLTDLPLDEVVYHVTKKGYASMQHVLAKPADNKVQVTLWPKGEVKGRVLNRETGEVIPNAVLIEGPQWPDRDKPTWQSHRRFELKDGHYQHEFKVHDAGMALRFEAPGFLQEETEVFYNDGTSQEHDVQLTPSSQIVGQVVDPKGDPASNVTVVAAFRRRPAHLKSGRLRVEPGEPHAETDAEGRFTLPAQQETYWLVAAGDQGIACISEEDFLNAETFQLQAWGRIEGKLWKGNQPAADAPVSCYFVSSSSRQPPVSGNYQTRTDAKGCFVFERLRPGQVTMFREQVNVRPGETTPFEWGQGGRAIEGQLLLPEGEQTVTFKNARFSLTGRADLADWDLPPIPVPSDRGSQWHKTRLLTGLEPAYKETLDRVRAIEKRSYSLGVNVNGYFLAQNILPGSYWVEGSFYEPEKDNVTAYRLRPFAYGRGILNVPENGLPSTEESLVLPDTWLTLSYRIEVGNLAPDIHVLDLNGKALSLSDLRGQHVLLDMGHRSYRGNIFASEIVPTLRRIQEKHHRGGLTVFSVDTTFGYTLEMIKSPLQQEVQDLGMTWRFGLVENAYGVDCPEFSAYTSSGHCPAFMLIDPEGRILATKIPLEDLEEVVDEAIGKP